MLKKLSFIILGLMFINLISASTELGFNDGDYLKGITCLINVSTGQSNSNLSLMVISGTGTININDRVMTKFNPAINTNYPLYFTTTPFNQSIVSPVNIRLEMKQDNITQGGTLNDTASTAVWTEVKNTGAPNGGLIHNETGGVIGGAYQGYWANVTGFDNYLYNAIPTFTIGTTTDFSMSGWVKASLVYHTSSSIDNLQVIIGENYGTSMTIYIRDYTNYESFALNMDDSNARGSQDKVLDNKWHFVTITRDYTSGSSSNVKIYTDGILSSSQTISDYITTTNDWYIGWQERTTWVNHQFLNGTADEIKFYDVILTEEQISNMYDFKDGYYCAEAWAEYNGGIEKSSQKCFTKDSINPKIIINTRYESSNGWINVSGTDLNNISMNIILDGIQIDYIDFNETINYINQTTLEKGTYNLTIILTDIAGNSITKEKTLDVINIAKVLIYAEDKNAIIRFFVDTKNAIIKFFINSK